MRDLMQPRENFSQLNITKKNIADLHKRDQHVQLRAY